MPLLLMLSLSILFVSLPVHAAVTSAADRTSFEQLLGAVTTEDFEEGAVAPATSVVIPGPIDETTSDAVFAPGDIAPGLTLHEQPDGSPGFLVVYGDGFEPALASTQLSFSDCAASMNLLFDTGVEAVGLDVYHLEPNASVTVSVYSGAALLDSFVVPSSGDGTVQFIGVSSDAETITRVAIAPSDDLYFTIDDIVFGGLAPQAIPALAGWAGVVLSGVLLGVGVRCVRSRAGARAA